VADAERGGPDLEGLARLSESRNWASSRDPHFIEKARVILDLYQGWWDGRRLDPRDQIICADEKPSIQARQHQVLQGLPWGRCEPKNGIAAFMRLVDYYPDGQVTRPTTRAASPLTEPTITSWINSA
jgi:hypothetical protein